MAHEDVCVVGLGLDLAGLWPDQPTVITAPAAEDAEQIAGLLDAFEGALARAGRAVVVVPGWLGDAGLRRVETALALMDTDRLALHRTELPPLGASVVAALAAAVAPHVGGAGLLAGALPGIERELVVGAWVASVAKLKRPAPSVSQHARSALPGAAFAVQVQPEPVVMGIGRGDDTPFEAPARPVELLIAPGPGADADWVLDVAVPALGDPPVRQIGPTKHAAAWWGTAKVVELVGHPTGAPQLAHRTVPADVVACRWCAELVAAAAPCPFCGERGRSAQAGSQALVGPGPGRS